MKSLPILIPSQSKQNEIDTLVTSLIELYTNESTEKLATNINHLQTRIAHTEEKIDQLVYELYQLTPEEIKLVEAATHE